jgi:predicted translin family RNA/ssDNA-binding protein
VTANENNSWISGVDAALENWRQGDCVIGDDHWFSFRFSPQYPLTEDSKEVTAANTEADLAESAVNGFAVLTQTCDLVRLCADRPFVEIAPLVEVDAEKLQDIKRVKIPRYAYISGVAEQNLVADLDRVMTVEKTVVAKWDRIIGCQNDEEIRAFGKSLSRKCSRFAFPDDFNAFIRKLQKRMNDKHEKTSDEGLALRALREIRVQATPSWDAEEIKLKFWFIHFQEEVNFKDKEWHELLDDWLKLLPASERFTCVEGVVMSVGDMTAAEYLSSDQLDLDRLSSS